MTTPVSATWNCSTTTAAWPRGVFTLGQNLHAIRVLEQFVERLDSHLTGQPVLEADQEVVSKLQGATGAGAGRVPDLRQGAAHPAVDLTLFRLWRFAHLPTVASWPWASC